RTSIWQHIRTHRRGFGIGIIGPPGCGKTTLLQHVLLAYAAHKQYSHRLRARIPFFIQLRKLTDIVTKDSAIDCADAIQHLMGSDRRYSEIAGSLPKKWVKRKLSSGACVLLLDGLDEVAELDLRKTVSSWLDQTLSSRRYRKNLFIVSARPGGY